MPRCYEFEAALQEIEPRIWRRLLLRTTSTFEQLEFLGEELGDGMVSMTVGRALISICAKIDRSSLEWIGQ